MTEQAGRARKGKKNPARRMIAKEGASLQTVEVRNKEIYSEACA